MIKKVLALLLVSILLILPLFSCVTEDTLPSGSNKASDTAASDDKESDTDETKESNKVTESVNNGNTDNGNTDNGNTDNGNTDNGNTDNGNTDNGNTDNGNTDNGNTDNGNTDNGNTDGGNTDSGNTDGGNTDNGGDDNNDNNDNNEDDDDNTGGGGLGEFVPEEVYYNVTYVIDESGTIEGEAIQRIKAGESSKTVKAVAAAGYVFAGWSDGIMTEERSETNVRDDITVSPIFYNYSQSYTIRYETHMAGKVIHTLETQNFAISSATYTAPNAPVGYTYSEWSDGKTGRERVDGVLSRDKTFIIEIVPISIDNVPTIEIITADGKGVTDRLNYKDCTVTLRNTDEEDCFEDVSAQLRGRGNSSWSYPKKGFKLKFDKKRTMLGSEHKAKSWIFISNYGDPSYLRNMIGYDMSNVFTGLDFTVMHEFIDVYIDNQYYGLFMLTDKIDVGKGRVDLDKTITEDPSQTAFILEIGAATQEDRDNGLVVKGVDYFVAGNDKSRSYFVEYPDTDDPAYIPEVHLTYIADYVDQCLLAVKSQDWELICELIDIDSFLDYYIIQELYMNKDCFWRSVHFYKEPGGKLHAGPVWDLDQGLGNVRDLFGTYNKETTPTTDISFADSSYNKESGKLWIASCNTWYRRLVRNEEFIDLLRVRLKEIGPQMMDVLQRATTDGSNPNSYYSLYKNAMQRDAQRWSRLGANVWPNTVTIVNIKTINGQIDYMREWMIDRYDVICDYYGVT